MQEEAKTASAREAAATVAMTGNPLLASAGAGGSAIVKRRWDDDVVFRNQVCPCVCLSATASVRVFVGAGFFMLARDMWRAPNLRHASRAFVLV